MSSDTTKIPSLEWKDDIAFGKHGDSYAMYQVFDDGELWISGPKWRQRKNKAGQEINHPNKTAKLDSKEYAMLIAENLNKLLNTEPVKSFYTK